MFTSEPSLAQRIERKIRETPIVDPHTHLRCDQPNVPDLAELLGDHSVQTELKSVGIPAEDLDPSLPVDERVRRAIPYLAKMRNTATSWALFRIFRDLYDFHDPVLTEVNYQELLDRVATSGKDPAWAHTVLREKCNIQTLVTSLGNKSADESRNPEQLYYRLDAHYLFCPGIATDLAPFFLGRTTRAEYVDALQSVLGETVETPAKLQSSLKNWLDRTLTGKVRFTSTFIPIDQRFVPPDESSVTVILRRAGGGQPLNDQEIDELVRFVTWKILEWHHEHRKAIQITVGSESLAGGQSIPRFQQSWTTEMAKTFRTFSDARFDLLMASDVLSQDVTVLARQFPNVSVSGHWDHNFFPPLIEKNIGLRLQIAPMAKWSGFLSDSKYCEWTYARLQVVKKSMARAFESLIEAGYYEEDEVPSILRQILHDTPKSIYELG